MIEEYQLRVVPKVAASEKAIKEFLTVDKGIDGSSVRHVRVLKRSIDARQRQIYVNLRVRVYINEEPTDEMFSRIEYPNVEGKPSVVVVGAGPGGLFAALRLIELGVRPIVVERGKDVHSRRKDIAQISQNHMVDPESNYSFGEGGAGAFSDGKLYTRSKKRGNTEKILNIFCQHGASTSILVDAHPHIGTDKLPGVIEAMRNTIIHSGGEVHFQTKMTNLILQGRKVVGIEAEETLQIAEGNKMPEAETHVRVVEFHGPVILATGHSARDVYRLLNRQSIELECKSLAVGVRLEHPSRLIDRIQYHSNEGKGKYLPTAEYSMVTQVEGRGVYSFCMCPGGTVVPASSGPNQVVVNGMSSSHRNSPWSNSGMVVELRSDDLNDSTLLDNAAIQTLDKILHSQGDHWDASSPLAMMHFQEYIERQTWLQGNRNQTAPAQRMADFVNGRLSSSLPETSYQPGVITAPLHFSLPKFISSRLQRAFLQFGKSSHGFLTNEATLIAIESRTSAPVRILRMPDTLQHVSVEGLFPCGEGAGYAGGIVSAGVDGERCAEKAYSSLTAFRH